MKEFKKVIWAGNYNQFLEWCHITKNNPENIIYLKDIYTLCGLKNYELIRYGTSYQRFKTQDQEYIARIVRANGGILI